MILPDHVPHHERLAGHGAFTGDMLLLGAHTSRIGTGARAFFTGLGAASVTTLDPDGGEIRADLNDDLAVLAEQYDSVFNLGTIEHVWNAHNAWANALRMVRTGGVFATHSPVTGYERHGIHVTGWRYIAAFVEANGFEPLDAWFSNEPHGDVLWLAARKTRHIAELKDYRCPQQVYRKGLKSPLPVCIGGPGAADTAPST